MQDFNYYQTTVFFHLSGIIHQMRLKDVLYQFCDDNKHKIITHDNGSAVLNKIINPGGSTVWSKEFDTYEEAWVEMMRIFEEAYQKKDNCPEWFYTEFEATNSLRDQTGRPPLTESEFKAIAEIEFRISEIKKEKQLLAQQREAIEDQVTRRVLISKFPALTEWIECPADQRHPAPDEVKAARRYMAMTWTRFNQIVLTK